MTGETRMTGDRAIMVQDMEGDDSTGREIQFDLTRVADGPHLTTSTKNSKSVKHVSFKQELESPEQQQRPSDSHSGSSPGKNMSGSSSPSKKKSGEMMPQSDLQELAMVLGEIQKRNEMVEAGLQEQVTCENPKLLEVLMEHIVLNWDELGDELLKDEINGM